MNLYKTRLMHRKAVSQIIGSLFMLTIVVGIGSVVLFQGLNGINAFNSSLTGIVTQKKTSTGEDLLIEHVRFDPSTTGKITIWVRNVGATDSEVRTIKIVKVDTQDLIVSQDNIAWKIYSKDVPSKDFTTTIGTPWSNYLNTQFKISITTQNGNSISTVVRPYNT